MEKVRKVRTNNAERYCLYYPDEGQYSKLMTLHQAKMLARQFEMAYIVNAETAEVLF